MELKEKLYVDKVDPDELEMVLQNEQSDGSDFPKLNEIETFAKKSFLALKDLNFSEKKAIVMNVIDRVVGKTGELEVVGYIPLIQNINVCTSYRNRRSPQRRQIDAL